MPVFPSYRNQSIDLLCCDFYMRATLAFNGLIINKNKVGRPKKQTIRINEEPVNYSTA